MFLKAAQIETVLGSMLAVADDARLYLLQFSDCQRLTRHIEQLKKRMDAVIVTGKTPVILKIKKELCDYFSGKSCLFETQLMLNGSLFQKNVWRALQQIPFGETRSYLDVANTIQKPTAFRAVANANAANPFAIIIPCHRVVYANGDLGGYAAGVSRKQWLIAHESDN